MTIGQPPDVSADEALQRLIAGNERFLEGRARSRGVLRETLAERNVRWTVRAILESPEGQARLAEGRMKIVGAVYEIATGRVRFLAEE